MSQEQYLVLARKYRPRNFESMIGQDALVRTLTNAIKANRLHHAYILNGVRGVGKTTSARILAKVLNCENGPSVTWQEDDPQCQAIEQGNHVDVLEFDAASHTGVDDIKELFEGVSYAPVQGRYKVYIIDEVHMLSKQAFNALLKTLEEPPEHVKFIFATTEVNKVPVTVLSRCQRFDLKRVSVTLLNDYFCDLLRQEKVKHQDGSIRLIAKAADGSVRDGLSLLDQAIALSAGKEITTELVGEMLGQVDRSRIYELFNQLMSGDSQGVLDSLSTMHNDGFDPLLVVTDLLQLAHLVTRIKIVPDLLKSPELSELEKTRGKEFADKLAMENLSRAYQMLFTVANEAKQADRPFETVEMGLIRVTQLAPLPAIAQLISQQASKAPVTAAVEQVSPVKKEVAPPPEEPNVQWNDWRSIVSEVQREQKTLAAMLEHQVRVVSLADNKLELNISQGVHSPAEIVQQLKQFLTSASGEAWTVTITEEGHTETIAEAKQREKQERIATAQQDGEIQEIIKVFPDAEVVDVIVK